MKNKYSNGRDQPSAGYPGPGTEDAYLPAGWVEGPMAEAKHWKGFYILDLDLPPLWVGKKKREKMTLSKNHAAYNKKALRQEREREERQWENVLRCLEGCDVDNKKWNRSVILSHHISHF